MFGLISRKHALKAIQPLVQQIQAYQRANTYNFPLYGFGDSSKQIDAYADIADLYTIVNKIMKTANLVPIYEYRIRDKKAYKKYRILERKAAKNPKNSILYEVKELQNEALELYPGEVQELLDEPNQWQSKGEFYSLCYLFMLLTGNRYIAKNVLTEAANAGKVYELTNLPPNFMYPLPTNDIPRRVGGYEFTLYNSKIPFTTEQIIHGKYPNPVFDYQGNELVGLSPLQAGNRTLTTTANQVEYANQSLKNAGAGGVMVAEDASDSVVEALGSMKEDVLRDLGSAYDGRSNVNVNKLGFLAGKWNYLKIFIDPVNMQLLEQSKYTFKQLCNIYGVDAKLFNNDEGAKYDNMDAAEQELYVNAALPLVHGLCDDLQRGLAPMYGEDVVIAPDITDIPALQENKETVIKSFASAPFVRANDFYEALGYGRIAGPDGDRILAKTGYTALEDVFGMPGEIPDDYDSNANS